MVNSVTSIGIARAGCEVSSAKGGRCCSPVGSTSRGRGLLVHTLYNNNSDHTYSLYILQSYHFTYSHIYTRVGTRECWARSAAGVVLITWRDAALSLVRQQAGPGMLSSSQISTHFFHPTQSSHRHDSCYLLNALHCAISSLCLCYSPTSSSMHHSHNLHPSHW